MKYITLSFLFFSFLFSCKKDPIPWTTVTQPVQVYTPYDTTNGAITALKLGVNWKAGGEARYGNNSHNTFHFVAYTVLEDSTYRETLSFSSIPIKTGEYVLKPIDYTTSNNFPAVAYNRLLSDGDAVGTSYKLDTTQKNNIFVDKIDTITRVAEGRFNIFCLINGTKYTKTDPDKVSFTKGKFKMKIR